MLHMRDPERDPLLTQEPSPGHFSASIHFPPQSQEDQIFKDLESRGATSLLPAMLSREHRPQWSPKEHNQKVRHGLLLPFIHIPNYFHGYVISQHLSPGPCAQATAVPVPLPGESLRGFLFISTPFLPGQRTLLTPKQAPRQVLQGAEEHHLIRGKDEKRDEASLLPVSYAP